jgi:hypothetical protein
LLDLDLVVMSSSHGLLPLAVLAAFCLSLSAVAAYQPGCAPARLPKRSALSPQMAGFGGAGAKKAGAKKAKVDKKAALSPRRQWDKFKDLVSSGADRHKVFARLDDKFYECGDVAVAGGTVAQAAQYNKRLILEHAVRVNPALTLRARELITGIAGADGEPEVLEKQEKAPDGMECGFEGLADASGMYSKVAGTTRNSDPTAIMGSTARTIVR